jgi:hypothetical protein
VITDPGELIAADLIAGPLLGAINSWPANPPFHYDREQNLDSLDAMLALDPTIVYVGRGPTRPVACAAVGTKGTPQARAPHTLDARRR